MAAVSSLLHEDQFLCSICLDVFTDPVTIPCGHNFCKTCITEIQALKRHKLVNPSHQIVSLREEYEAKKAVLSETEAEVQKMIKERQVKIEDFKQSVKLSKEDADRETATSVHVFTALIRSVEEGLAQLIDLIKEKHSTTEKQAEDFIKVLEEEISELTKRITEVEEHSRNKDHLQFLESFPLLNPAPPTKDWTKVRVYSSYERRKALRTALAQLQEMVTKEVKKMCSDVELKEVQQFAVDVTLDPETAQRELMLSDDGKQIRHASIKRIYSDSSKRFLSHFCVVGKQSFSSGRSYYEVQVGGKTDWLVGVARESINRKVPLTFSPQKGLWTVWLDEGKFKAYTDPPVNLCLNSKPQKVGVFVDYEEGLVSFYDVDAPALIYSFTGCNFTEKLFPIFNPKNNNGGRNSTPLIICPIPIVLQRCIIWWSS
uniref:E3 ubiquitin-protein ligase TRIM39-like n=1 Tax=Labrus bergylta TaxID=56723 RepID=A0A3Q3GMR7_9LABR